MRGKRTDQVQKEGNCCLKMVGKESLKSSFVEEIGKQASSKIMILASFVVVGEIQSNVDPSIIFAVDDNNVPIYCFYLLEAKDVEVFPFVALNQILPIPYLP